MKVQYFPEKNIFKISLFFLIAGLLASTLCGCIPLLTRDKHRSNSDAVTAIVAGQILETVSEPSQVGKICSGDSESKRGNIQKEKYEKKNPHQTAGCRYPHAPSVSGIPLAGTDVFLCGKKARTDSGGYYYFKFTYSEFIEIGKTRASLHVALPDGDTVSVEIGLASFETKLNQIIVDRNLRVPVVVLENSVQGITPALLSSQIENLITENIDAIAGAGDGPGSISGLINIQDANLYINSVPVLRLPSVLQPYIEMTPVSGVTGLYRYIIRNVPKGTVLVEAVRNGYNPVSRTLKVYPLLENSNVDLMLVPVESRAGLTLAIVSGDRQSGVVGNSFTEPLIVKVTDSSGAPVSGVSVLFMIVQGTGTVDASLSMPGLQNHAITDSSGLARCERWIPGNSGVHSLRASIPGGDVHVIFTASVNQAGNKIEKIQDSNSGDGSVPAGSERMLSVIVKNERGQTVPGVTVSFAITADPGKDYPGFESSISNTSVATDSAGRASIVLTTSRKTGTNSVRATLVGSSESVEFNVIGTPLQPYSVTFLEPAGTVVSPDIRTATVSVEILDQYGNRVADGTVVSFSVSDPQPANTGQAGSINQTALTYSGIARAILRTSGVAGDDYIVVATVNGLSATSGKFVVGNPDVKKLELVLPESVLAGERFEVISLKVVDEAGRTLTDVSGNRTLSWSGPSIAPGGAAPVYTTNVNFVNGVASHPVYITLFRAETVNVTVSDGTLRGTSGPVTVKPLSLAAYSVTMPARASGDGITPFSVTVSALDIYGNVTTGASDVSLIAVIDDAGTMAPGTLGGSTTGLDLSSGTLVVSNLTYSSLGVIKIKARDASGKESNLSATTPAVFEAGQPASLRITGPASIIAGGNARVTVIAYDPAGNIATAYSGNKQLIWSGVPVSRNGTNSSASDSTGAFIPFGQATTTTFTSGMATVTLKLYRAGNFSIDVTDGTSSSEGNETHDLDISVVPSSLAGYRIEVAGPVYWTLPFSMTVTPEDSWGNSVTGSANVTLSHNGTGVLSVTSCNTSAGAAVIPNQIYNKAETIIISATDGVNNGSTGITFNTAAANSLNMPAASTSVNHARVSYVLGEDASSATITWTRTGGSADPGSPHVVTLTGDELKAGLHDNIVLANSPALVSDAVYRVALNSVSAATGAPAIEVANESVKYDITAPSDPVVAFLGVSARTGKVTVSGGTVGESGERLRIYINDVLAGESAPAGNGGFQNGSTPITGLSLSAGQTVKYSLVDEAGQESNIVSDGTIPAAPDASLLGYSAARRTVSYRASLNGTSNAGKSLLLTGGSSLYISTSFNNNSDGTLLFNQFTPELPVLAGGTTILYSIIDANGNESSTISDGVVPLSSSVPVSSLACRFNPVTGKHYIYAENSLNFSAGDTLTLYNNDAMIGSTLAGNAASGTAGTEAPFAFSEGSTVAYTLTNSNGNESVPAVDGTIPSVPVQNLGCAIDPVSGKHRIRAVADIGLSQSHTITLYSGTAATTSTIAGNAAAGTFGGLTASVLPAGAQVGYIVTSPEKNDSQLVTDGTVPNAATIDVARLGCSLNTATEKHRLYAVSAVGLGASDTVLLFAGRMWTGSTLAGNAAAGVTGTDASSSFAAGTEIHYAVRNSFGNESELVGDGTIPGVPVENLGCVVNISTLKHRIYAINNIGLSASDTIMLYNNNVSTGSSLAGNASAGTAGADSSVNFQAGAQVRYLRINAEGHWSPFVSDGTIPALNVGALACRFNIATGKHRISAVSDLTLGAGTTVRLYDGTTQTTSTIAGNATAGTDGTDAGWAIFAGNTVNYLATDSNGNTSSLVSDGTIPSAPAVGNLGCYFNTLTSRHAVYAINNLGLTANDTVKMIAYAAPSYYVSYIAGNAVAGTMGTDTSIALPAGASIGYTVLDSAGNESSNVTDGAIPAGPVPANLGCSFNVTTLKHRLYAVNNVGLGASDTVVLIAGNSRTMSTLAGNAAAGTNGADHTAALGPGTAISYIRRNQFGNESQPVPDGTIPSVPVEKLGAGYNANALRHRIYAVSDIGLSVNDVIWLYENTTYTNSLLYGDAIEGAVGPNTTAAMAAGSTVNYIRRDENGNWSPLTSDGIIPAPPNPASLGCRLNPATNLHRLYAVSNVGLSAGDTILLYDGVNLTTSVLAGNALAGESGTDTMAQIAAGNTVNYSRRTAEGNESALVADGTIPTTPTTTSLECRFNPLTQKHFLYVSVNLTGTAGDFVYMYYDQTQTSSFVAANATTPTSGPDAEIKIPAGRNIRYLTRSAAGNESALVTDGVVPGAPAVSRLGVLYQSGTNRHRVYAVSDLIYASTDTILLYDGSTYTGSSIAGNVTAGTLGAADTSALIPAGNTVGYILRNSAGIYSELVTDGVIPPAPTALVSRLGAAYNEVTSRHRIRAISSIGLTAQDTITLWAGTARTTATIAGNAPAGATGTDTAAAIGTGTTVNYSLRNAQGNESTLASDGVIPAPPSVANLGCGFNTVTFEHYTYAVSNVGAGATDVVVMFDGTSRTSSTIAGNAITGTSGTGAGYEITAGNTINYSLINAEGNESALVADGTIPTASTILANLGCTYNAATNRHRIYAVANIGLTASDLITLFDETTRTTSTIAGNAVAGTFGTDTAAAIAPGRTVNYMVKNANGNESSLSADGTIPDPPNSIHLANLRIEVGSTSTQWQVESDGAMVFPPNMTVLVSRDGTAGNYVQAGTTSASGAFTQTANAITGLVAGNMPRYRYRNSFFNESAPSEPDGIIVALSSATASNGPGGTPANLGNGDTLTLTFTGPVVVPAIINQVNIALGSCTATVGNYTWPGALSQVNVAPVSSGAAKTPALIAASIPVSLTPSTSCTLTFETISGDGACSTLRTELRPGGTDFIQDAAGRNCVLPATTISANGTTGGIAATPAGW